MAGVKSPVLRRLEKALARRFPPPATIKLEDHDGIVGVITSPQFAGMETIDRQDLIGEVVDESLRPDDRRRILVIVGVTPDEGTGYLAGED